MDTETKVLLVGLAALAGGVALGWYLRLEQRRGRSPLASARPVAGGDSEMAMIPVGGASGCCTGCRS